MNDTINVKDLGVVHSSGGELTINIKTGKVLQIHCHDDEYRSEFNEIDRFDMDEWHKTYPFDQQTTEFDILDLGCFLKDGSKAEPEYSYRKQSHWDRVYEHKQFLIEEVMLHIQNDLHEDPDTESLAQLLNKVPIPDLYRYLPEHNLHKEKFKYLIDNQLTHYANQYQESNDYFGFICPQCRTPLDEFDQDQMECPKCNILINWQEKGD